MTENIWTGIITFVANSALLSIILWLAWNNVTELKKNVEELYSKVNKNSETLAYLRGVKNGTKPPIGGKE